MHCDIVLATIAKFYNVKNLFIRFYLFICYLYVYLQNLAAHFIRMSVFVQKEETHCGDVKWDP